MFATCHKKNRFVDSARSDHSFAGFKLYRAQGLDYKTFISFLDTLKERTHLGILKVEVSEFLANLSIGNVSHNRILLNAMHIEVKCRHGSS